MRLREIYSILNENVDAINLSIEGRRDSNYNITNFRTVVSAVNRIESLGVFKDSITQLKTTKLYEGYATTLVVNQNELLSIKNAIEILSQSVKGTLKSLEVANIDLENDSLCISIQLPDSINFDKLSKIFDRLKKSIEVPLADFPDGENIEIKNFDSGSFWIDFIAPTSACMGLIGSIVWSGAVIYKKIQEARSAEAYATSIKMQSEHIANMKELAKQQIALYIETEAKLIEKENYSDSDHERLERIKLSINEMSKLILDGVKVQPSVSASEELRNLFPVFSTIDLIESKVKHIENKK